MYESAEKSTTKISTLWQQMGYSYDLSRLKEQGVDPDRILSSEGLFLKGDLSTRFQDILKEREEVAKKRKGYVDNYSLREAQQELEPKINALRGDVVKKEAERLSQQYGYSEAEALELARKNTAGIELDASYVAVSPDQNIIADVYLGGDFEAVHTRLAGVCRPTFERPRPMQDSPGCVLMNLEVINDPNGHRKAGQIVTTNLEPYWWKIATPTQAPSK